MEERQHHPAGPSSLGRLVDCPGSYRLGIRAAAIGATAEGNKKYAEEGTILHARTLPHSTLDDLTAEQRDAVTAAREEADRFFEGYAWWPERRVEIRLPTGNIFGTADRIGHNGVDGRVIDFKFGHGDLNEHDAYWQCLAYSVAAMQEFGVDTVTAEVFAVRARQPYVHVFTGLADCLRQIQQVVEAAMSEQASARPSERACKYCRAQLICPEFAAQIVDKSVALREEYSAKGGGFSAMTVEQLSHALDVARAMEPWAAKLRDHARSVIRSGGAIPGYEIQESKVREFRSVPATWEAVGSVLDQGAFLALCSVGVGALENACVALLRARGLSAKEAKQTFGSMVAGVVTYETRSALTKVKE